ncbi:MAG TPA: type II secretion system F family protein [bacterium]|nr:type II secretion system F family protein [bacterium]
MPHYDFVARDQLGRNYRGTLYGPSEQSVFFRLQKIGYIVLSVTEKEEKDKIEIFTQNITQADIVIFSRLLGTVVDTGIPLVDALAAIEEQISNTTFRKIIRKVSEDVENGSSLSAAFEKHPHIFPHLFIAMVNSGELSGRLSEVLEKASDYLESDMELRRSISNSFVYPKIVLTIAFVGIIIVMKYFIPAIAGIYAQTPKLKLPKFTKVLLSTSNYVSDNWIFFLALIAAMIAGYYFFKKSRMTRPYYDALIMSVPIMGTIMKRILIVRSIHTLGSMIECGVPLITALETVKSMTGNIYIEHDLDRVIENVEAGGTISNPLRMSRMFPPIVTYMIAAGEKSGRMHEMLINCTAVLEKEIQFMVKRTMIMLEPAVTIVVALVIAFIAIAIYLPFYQIMTLVPK